MVRYRRLVRDGGSVSPPPATSSKNASSGDRRGSSGAVGRGRRVRFASAAALTVPVVVVSSVPLANVGNSGVTIFDLTVAVLAVTVIVGKEISTSWRRRDVEWIVAMVVFVSVLGLSLVREPDLTLAIPALGGLVLGMSVVFLIAALPLSIRLKTIVGVWLLAASGVGLLSVVQATAGGRATGLFRFPNELAAYGLATLALVAVAVHRRVPLPRPVLVGGVLGAVLALLGSGSKAGVLGMTAALPIIAALALHGGERRRRVRLISSLVLAVAVISFTLLVAFLTEIEPWIRRSQSDPLFDGSRSGLLGSISREGLVTPFHAENWRDGFDVFIEAPVLGVGNQNAFVFSEVHGDWFEIHNFALFFLARYGLVGVAVLLIPLFVLYRGRLQSPMALLIVLIPIGVFSMYHDIAESRSIWLSLAIMLALMDRWRPREQHADSGLLS